MAFMCADHPGEGFMCHEHLDLHHEFDLLGVRCDTCPMDATAWGEFVEEQSSTLTWTGAVRAHMRRQCLTCAGRLASVREVIALRRQRVQDVVNLWLEAGAPGSDSATRFGYCWACPNDMQTYEGLLEHLATAHTERQNCAACDLTEGTIARDAQIVVTPVGNVEVPLLALICADCERADRGVWDMTS